jgi:sialidase-1
VSMWQSAYSTMILQHDGRIGFLWEEGPTVYNIDYESLSLKDITGGELR